MTRISAILLAAFLLATGCFGQTRTPVTPTADLWNPAPKPANCEAVTVDTIVLDASKSMAKNRLLEKTKEQVIDYINQSSACTLLIIARFGVTFDVVSDGFIDGVGSKEHLAEAVRSLKPNQARTNLDEAAKGVEWLHFKLLAAYPKSTLIHEVRILTDNISSPSDEKPQFNLRKYLETHTRDGQMYVVQAQVQTEGTSIERLDGQALQVVPVDKVLELLRQSRPPQKELAPVPVPVGQPGWWEKFPPYVWITGTGLLLLALVLVTMRSVREDPQLKAAIVAVTTPKAVAEAERLLPGAHSLDGEFPSLRVDSLRPGSRALFRIANEYADPEAEDRLAAITGCQEEWVSRHAAALSEKIQQVNRSWSADAYFQGMDTKSQDEIRLLWHGRSEADYLRAVPDDMRRLLETVPKKGEYGAMLRRELYRRPFHQHRPESFFTSVDALQRFTERLMQSALSSKSGAGVTQFKYRAFFSDPRVFIDHGTPTTKRQAALRMKRREIADSFTSIDKTLDFRAVCALLDRPVRITGLLRWLARPTHSSLFVLLQNDARARAERRATTPQDPLRDPRIGWYFS